MGTEQGEFIKLIDRRSQKDKIPAAVGCSRYITYYVLWKPDIMINNYTSTNVGISSNLKKHKNKIKMKLDIIIIEDGKGLRV